MHESRFVSRETWLQARKKLLQNEKEFNQTRDALSAARRDLPLVNIDKPYMFDTERGQESLGDLFKGQRQLIVYHFMFGADWEEGCPSCSFWMDNFNGAEPHLAARDTSLVLASTAPLDKLLAYRKRLGWQMDWVSSGGSDFNQDFGVTFPGSEPGPTGGYNYRDQVFGEEMPGLSVFERFDDGAIGHSYSTYGRGLDMLNGTYHLLDLTPMRRNEAELDYPQAWVRRHDQY